MNLCHYQLSCVLLFMFGYVESSPYIPKPELGLAIKEIIGSLSNAKCFPTFIADGTITYNHIAKDMNDVYSEWGVGVFEVPTNIYNHSNNYTLAQFTRLIQQARMLRKSSWCVMIVLMSDDPTFLTNFAEWSLNNRLMVWSTKLLIVSRLPKKDIGTLISSYWTFSMNNAMVLSIQESDANLRYAILVHLPYTSKGAQVKTVASWTKTKGLRYHTSLNLYPDKYINFYGATVNVTALTYEPYWIARKHGNTTKYSGIDYNQLVALSDSLNFVIQVLTPTSWRDMTDLVEARISFIASVVTVVLPNRLERWDYTHTFDYSPLCFAMAKPVLKPNWLSFYEPFSTDVWIGILVSVIVVCFTFVKITGTKFWRSRHGRLSAGSVIMETVGSLLGQGLYGRVSTSQSNLLLSGIWLLFGVVVSTGYRGSLIAFLTLPKLPPRPETVEELVTAVDRATIESFGFAYKNFLTASPWKAYRALGILMYLGVHVSDGLTDALTLRRAHLGSRQYLDLTIAQKFTRIDGSTPLYTGREMIIPATSGWPIPHDAPYKPALDKKVIAITEAGLYKKWRGEMLEEASRESRVTKRKELKKLLENQEEPPQDEGSGDAVKSLTLVHMQGPLLLLLIGLALGTIAFVAEKCLGKTKASATEGGIEGEP